MSRPQNSCQTLLWPTNQPIRAPKRQKWPQIKSNSNVTIHGIIENESCSTTWVDPILNPKIAHRGPKKINHYPKIKANSNVRNQEIIKNESCSTTWVDPKTIFEPHIEPKNSPLGPRNQTQPQISTQFQLNLDSISSQPHFNISLKSTSGSTSTSTEQQP